MNNDGVLRELDEAELAQVSGGAGAGLLAGIDDAPWCGTKPPGWHPPRPSQNVGVALE
jgi:bacteriocin-like protein